MDVFKSLLTENDINESLSLLELTLKCEMDKSDENIKILAGNFRECLAALSVKYSSEQYGFIYFFYYFVS
jgi:hypothetical protein